MNQEYIQKYNQGLPKGRRRPAKGRALVTIKILYFTYNYDNNMVNDVDSMSI